MSAIRAQISSDRALLKQLEEDKKERLPVLRPELEVAAQEMQCVTRTACIEVAEMPRPPQAVKDTVNLVMMCFPPPTMRQYANKTGTHWNKQPTEWERAQAFLRDP